MMQKSKIKNQKSKLQFKMQNFGFWFVILIFGFWILNFNCYAQSISSRELINNAKDYDGKAVVYAGEVIGDVMQRGDYVWVNVNDGENAIGVWAEKTLVKDIQFSGSYKAKGDWAEVKGIFHRACVQHGADLDIHAAELQKIVSGQQMSANLDLNKKNLALILFLILGGVWILQQLRRK